MIWGGSLGKLPEVRYRTSFIVKRARREVEVDWSHGRQALNTTFSWQSPTGSGVGKTINILTDMDLSAPLLEPTAKSDTTYTSKRAFWLGSFHVSKMV